MRAAYSAYSTGTRGALAACAWLLNRLLMGTTDGHCNTTQRALAAPSGYSGGALRPLRLVMVLSSDVARSATPVQARTVHAVLAAARDVRWRV